MSDVTMTAAASESVISTPVPSALAPGFALDQYGDRYIVFQRNGSLWVLGLDDGCLPFIRLLGDGNYVHTDLSKPRGVRILRQHPKATGT